MQIGIAQRNVVENVRALIDLSFVGHRRWERLEGFFRLKKFDTVKGTETISKCNAE